MNWIVLEDYSQIQKALSQTEPFLVFKHSTRCSISSLVKSRFERTFNSTSIKLFYLDLLRFRSLSNQLAHDFKIKHESPQVIIIKDSTCIYHASHNSIDADVIKGKL